MREDVADVGLAVPRHALDIATLALRFYRQTTDARAAELGKADDIVGTAGTDRIEAKHGEHLPGTHLSGIVITGQSAGNITILRPQDVADQQLGLPRLASQSVKIGNVVAGLIAMPIIIGAVATSIMSEAKECVELLYERLATTHDTYQSRNVMGNIEAIVHDGTLGDKRQSPGEVAIAQPSPVGMATVGPARTGIQYVHPVV